MKPLKQWTFADVIALVKGVDKKIWMRVLAGAVGFLVIFVFFVIPAWVERPLLWRDIQSMETQIRQINALNEKRAGWEEKQKIFGRLIEETQGRVFTEDSMGMLLGQISKMADESRVDVLSSKPLTEKTAFPAPYNLKFQTKGYELTVQGGYHDLANLASRIESHNKLLRIQSLEIVPSDKTPERHVAELKLRAILATPSALPSVEVSRAKK